MEFFMPSPFGVRNIRLFILFRLCYHCRFYYPIFTILFLDFGLTLSQFALLNVIWAATIVCSEVPSGALADTIGRKKLVVLSAAIMVIELAVIAFVPLGNSSLIFTVFLVNRVLSGFSEALASGADEALAYDSLAEQGDKNDWSKVLERLMRWQSIAFIITTLLGAAIYDPNAMTYFLSSFGYEGVLDITNTMRYPIYATLLLGCIALWSAWQMEEAGEPVADTSDMTRAQSIRHSLSLTLTTGKWILATPLVLIILLYDSLFDHVIRMMMTLNSQYYRAILIPEVYLGIIGASTSLLGMVVPRASRWLVEEKSPKYNLFLVGGIAAVSFWLLGLGTPYFGIFPMVLLSSIAMAVRFFSSHYLHQYTDSKRRATVLSFKGLLFNLAYGSIGIFYALLIGAVKDSYEPGELQENEAFLATLPAFLYYYLALFIVMTLFARKYSLPKLGRSDSVS